MSLGRKFAAPLGLRSSRDQRKATRKKVGANAWIRFGGSFAVRPCSVTDISDSGVQITVLDAEPLPNEFTLLMSKGGTGRRARVKWRRGSKVGAAFV